MSSFVVLLQVVTVLVFYRSSPHHIWRSSIAVQVEPNELHNSENSLSGIRFDANRVVTLVDDEFLYFQPIGKAPLCYVEGTSVSQTLSSNSTKCLCRPNYFGNECGIPAAVWHRTISRKYHKWPVKPRKVPRRIIHGLNINHEIDFFRVRLEELKVV